jgi:hypothetical protein
MTSFTDHARNDAIAARRAQGETLASIARAFGIGPERVRTIVEQSHHRQQLQALGLTTRAWNVLAKMGLVRRNELDTITREALIARLAGVDLADIGAQKNCGVSTVHDLARLLDRPGRYKQRGTGVVRV